MRRRRHYATTGNRAFLSVLVKTPADAEVFDRDPAAGRPVRAGRASLLMGDIARVATTRSTWWWRSSARQPIERLDIWDGLDHLETIRPYGEAELGARVRLI